MVIHTTTRRNAIVALVLVVLLVLGGLSWATRSAMRLERLEAHAAAEQSYDETRSLALARLDWLLDSVLGVERSRPYDVYRSFYKPPQAYDPRDLVELREPVLLPSPLQTLRGPDWLLLHFQASVTQGWSSPQLDVGAESAIPAGAIPASDRAHEASTANWLAALRERYDPWLLLQVLEEAQIADIERRKALATYRVDDASGDWGAGGGSGDTGMRGQGSRTAAEFARRGARLLQRQRENFPLEQCEPQLVALDNLQAGGDVVTPLETGKECVQVWGTPMLPVWLDLTMDDRLQLTLVRAVSVETSEYCTLQGVLIDWDRLRGVLEQEVQDLLPRATIEPVKLGTRSEPNMLHTIPARLSSGMPDWETTGSISTGLRWGLIVAWGATILALVAICYGTMKYVTLSERRMRFVAAVTHELRTPLTTFQLYTDLLADAPNGDPRQRGRYIATLGRESKRLARLVENVLVYSKMGDAQPVLQRTATTPQGLIDAAAAQTLEKCRASGKELVVENRCDEAVGIETDRELVIQILANLIDNACKYSADAPDPRVLLTTTITRSGDVLFEVEDAGRGVSLSDRRAVFEAFRRGRPSAGAGTGGMGLGLALSRYWAGCLGGSLTLKRSRRIGSEYSRFSLSLPSRS
jgi:signal transduction histidine kinase